MHRKRKEGRYSIPLEPKKLTNFQKVFKVIYTYISSEYFTRYLNIQT